MNVLLRRSAWIFLACLTGFLMGASLPFRNASQPITAAIIEQAAQLIGLSFTRAEMDTMQSGLEELRTNYEKNRQHRLENAVAPVLYFNPVLPGMTFPREKKPFRASAPTNVKLPANRDELAFYSVGQLGELIRTKQITSLELTQFFLDRLKKYDTTLKAVVSLTEDYAMAQARKADEEIRQGKYRGVLHGIPYGAKDLLAKKGYKTTWGSVPYKNQTINLDATVIQRLEAAGAVLVAKLTLGELAMGDVWFGGKTRNPWNPQEGSSGSSAGSGATVAAGLVPFAIGTETLGSIVSPSTVCGVTGLRPTFGRVSRHGAMALSWTMDKIGPMARTVEDCALVFNAMYGPDGHDLTVQDFPFNYDAAKKISDLRIGYVKTDFEKDYDFKKQDSLTLATLRKMGVQLVPLELPNLPANDLGFIISAESAAAFDELTRNNLDDQMVRQTKNAWPNEFRTARFIPAVEYIQANRHRALLMQAMHERLRDVDVYLAPSWEGRNLMITNLTGHPCVVLPNGFDDKGLPTSITFTGRLFGEADVLAVAKAYQDATDFHTKHPKLSQ